MFLSKSMPLYSFFLEPECTNFHSKNINHVNCIFRVLSANFSDTLDHISMVLWHTNQNLDPAYMKFLKAMKSLHSFELYGVSLKKKTIEDMCELIIHHCDVMYLKIHFQEDFCQPGKNQKLIGFIKEKYCDMFRLKNKILELDVLKK
uniref:Uncharacterized protein n=1 Tax=Clastoptera arizonana TaxID=38151 RepID=A0A1B6C2Z1_9HEMI